MISQGILERNQINTCVCAAEQFAQKEGLDKRACLRFRLSLEEILLIYLEESDKEAEFVFKLKKRGGDIRGSLTVKGQCLDPFSVNNPILERVIRNFEGAPVWSYEDGANHLEYTLPLYNTLAKNIRMSWKYMSGQRATFVLAVVSQFISVGLNVAAPILSARVITQLNASVFAQILMTALALMIVRAVNNFFLFVSNRSYNRVYNKTLSNLESDLVQNVLRVVNDCIDEKGTGLFIQRLTADTTSLATGFNTLADLVSQMCNYIGILAAMLIVSPKVFAFVAALLAFLSWLEWIRTKRMKKDDRVYREANERFTGFVNEMVKGSKDIKHLHSEHTFKEELDRRILDANDKRMIMQANSWKYKLSRWEFGEVGFFAFIVILALSIAEGSMTPVNAIILFNYYSELGAPAVLLVGQLLEFIKDFNLSAERVYALISSPEFPKEEFGAVHKDSIRGEIRFEHVRFSYKNPDPVPAPRLVLNDLSFEIPAGTTAALVGRSGCGKTTTFQLINKLYSATGGKVYIDGIDIQELDQDTIRSHIAVVSQNPYIFHLSVRDNLKLVKPDLTEEEMRRVCALACIDEDIACMPDGYDTLIGEDGTNLSGGQRQRLAIARTLLKEFRILLLDEATSALDNVTQAKIQHAIRNIQKDHTVVMIAHRLSTIRDADKIIYMEGGKVLDEGTHQELIDRCPAYRELYEIDQVKDRTGPENAFTRL